MKYAWIEQQRGEYSLSRLCQVLAVSRSGYHAWVQREPSAREHADEPLGAAIEVHSSTGRRSSGLPEHE